MGTAQGSGYEREIIGFYIRNVVVCLPLTIVLLKLLVRFFTREPAKDLFRSVLVLPLDLLYVAFGLLLAAIARRIPAFASHYRSDKEADFAGFILGVGLFLAACLVTWMDRGVRLLWQKFYAGWALAKEIQDNAEQMILPGQRQPHIRKVAVIYLWLFAYWSLMVPLIFLQIILAVESVGMILKKLE